MKLKKGFELRDVCGEKVIIAQGLENLDFSKLINLNESAAYLWENLQDKDFTVEDMAALLCKEYEVDLQQATTDCKTLVANWKAQGLIA